MLYKASVEASPKLSRLARWLKTSLTVPVPVPVPPFKQNDCCVNDTGLLLGFKVSNVTCVYPNAEDRQLYDESGHYRTDQLISSTAFGHPVLHIVCGTVHSCIRHLGCLHIFSVASIQGCPNRVMVDENTSCCNNSTFSIPCCPQSSSSGLDPDIKPGLLSKRHWIIDRAAGA